MKAATFAANKHRHQIRKDGVTPYIAHPFRVAMIVRDLFNVDDEEILAAALLHDTIEDTTTDYDEIEALFSNKVADIVGALTKDMRLPKKLREQAYDRQLAEGPWEAKLIKLADVLDNITDAHHTTSGSKVGNRVSRALELVAGDERLAPAAIVLKEFAETLTLAEARR